MACEEGYRAAVALQLWAGDDAEGEDPPEAWEDDEAEKKEALIEPLSGDTSKLEAGTDAHEAAVEEDRKFLEAAMILKEEEEQGYRHRSHRRCNESREVSRCGSKDGGGDPGRLVRGERGGGGLLWRYPILNANEDDLLESPLLTGVASILPLPALSALAVTTPMSLARKE